MQKLGGSHITYSEDELPIPTFHCECGETTEGFSICLKCNPQTYEVIGMSEKNKYYETIDGKEVYMGDLAKAVWNAAIEAAAKIIDDCNRVFTLLDFVLNN